MPRHVSFRQNPAQYSEKSQGNVRFSRSALIGGKIASRIGLAKGLADWARNRKWITVR